MTVDADEFTGKVALVTGAAGAGIGRAIAARLLAGGADVVVTDSHAGRVETVTADLAAQARAGQRVVGKVLDVADYPQADLVAAQVLAEIGPVRILVNNAAVNVMAPIWEFKPEDWARIMQANLNGPWYLSKIFMRQMRDAGGGGVIINISSVAPDFGAHGHEAPYAVSKGGLNTLTRSCAHEGGPFNIRANTITMGVVTGTRFTEVLHPDMIAEAAKGSPLGRLPHATDIAEAAAFLASDRARCITGETLNVAAGSYMRY